MPALPQVIIDGSGWEGDCLLWRGRAQPNGYGKIGDRYVHRIAFEAVHGPIPEGKVVDHSCHQTLCVNPEHLRAATYSENMWNRSGPASHNRSGVRGVRNVAAWGYKLPWEARVTVNGVRHERRFATLEEAAEAVEQMRRELLPADFVGKG